MTPVELSRTVLHAVRRAVDQGELSVAVPARAVVTPPGPGGSGDYATSIALQLARPAGRPPRQVAEILRPHLSRTEGVAAVEITGPGFLNIHLDRAAVTSLVGEVLDRRDDGLPYGHSDALAGQVVRLRIPYDIRAEVVADAVVRIVGSQGGRVEVDHVRPSASRGQGRGSRTAGGLSEAPSEASEASEASETSQASQASVASDERDDSAEAIDLRPVPAAEDPTPLGPDALRWALLHPAAHDRPRITADLLVQRAANPLFRVRYAHARARALTRNAATLGFTSAPGRLDATTVTAEPSVHLDAPSGPGATPGVPGVPGPDGPAPNRAASASGLGITTSDVTAGIVTTGGVAAGGDCGVIAAPFTAPGATTASDPTTPLLTAISEYPHVLLRAATHRTPDRLARHLVVTADALLAFQHTVLPRGDEKPSAAHRARLALAEAAGTVLAGGLSLLGIDAPEYL